MAEPRVIRNRQIAQQQALETAIGKPPHGANGLLVRTTHVDTYPTKPNAVYFCNILGLDGSLKEGSPAKATVLDTKSSVPVYNLGAVVPKEGTIVIACNVGGRWTMRYDG